MPIQKKPKSVRLASHVIPERYSFVLKPDIQTFTFEGTETISVTLLKSTKEITLHSKELSIDVVEAEFGKDPIRTDGASPTSNGARKIFAQKISYDVKAETATFLFSKAIPKGKIKLHLVFKGIINDRMRGFYRSSYQIGGETKHIVTTQFEATDARQAFPCFDEPSMKAIFDISLAVPSHLAVVSNTLPIETTPHSEGYKLVRFASTPKMSTYLAAFIIGDLEHIEKKTKEGITIRVYTTPGKKHQASFALDVAEKCLRFYGEYFGIPYPLNTLDLIAIPDFAAGAMENWGAVTYRESALLVDPDHSSTANKEWVAIVIAHELAHQWFGNLVTMEWWTDLWLNEGFATYAEYLAVDHVFPEWHIWEQFAVQSQGEALSLDSLLHTHPIEVTVHHPGEINEIFDKISYMKGASVIRMLAEYLGEAVFRKGLRAYLKEHSYKNARTADLWKSLEKASGKPVGKIMGGWTKQAGYPLVQVEKVGKKCCISQQRFFSSPFSEKKVKEKTVWNIPLISSLPGKKVSKMLFSKKKADFGGGDGVKLNFGEAGFYRVGYPKETLLSFGKYIQSKEFSAEDRLGIIRDCFALSEVGKMETVPVLELLQSFKKEESFIVWSEIISGLRDIFTLTSRETFAEKYKLFAKEILKDIFAMIGFEARKGEAHSHVLLRSLVLSSNALFGNEKVIEWAKKKFALLERGEKSVHPDIRGVVYSTIARYGNESEHTHLVKMYLAETLQEEKMRIGRALGSFQDKKCIEKTLAFSITKDVRPQDTISLVGVSLMNSHARDITWEFLKKNWNLFLTRYGEAGYMLPRLIELLHVFDSLEKAKEIETFFKKHSAPSAERTIQQVLEKIRSNALWKGRLVKELGRFLK